MLPSVSSLARTSATLLTAAACSAAPSPSMRDSVALTAKVPATPATASAAAPVRPDTTSRVPSSTQGSFTRILTQNASGFEEPAEMVIRDQAALEAAWGRVFNQVQGNPAPVVDFGRETVILVALGSRRSGGHTVHVDAVKPAGDGALVRYTATSPGPGCMTTQSLTSPVDVVRAPRITGTVAFRRHDAAQPC